VRILILGGGVMQLPAVRLAKRKGWSVVVAAAGIVGEIEALADRSERVDLRDREAVALLAENLKEEGGLDGVFTAGTDFSTTVAWVAERLGLPGIPYEAALRATDKARMRATFESQRVPSPPFCTVREGTAAAIPRGFPFPLVVKPVDNMGARGVRRVDDEAQLRAALEVALEQSASGQAIVEQYLEGPELSLDAVIHEGTITVCGVADRHICFPPYFVEMGHTMPSGLDPVTLKEAEEVFRRGIRALGITHGAAKGDIKITPEGPVVGEIAARLSGGYMSGWTYPFASGVEVTGAALEIAVGLPPGDLKPRRNWVSAERAFVSIPGTVKALEGLEAAGTTPGIEELFPRVSPGQEVTLPINNMGKCGNLISMAPRRRQAVEAAESAVRSIFLRLEPSDPRTDGFLGETKPARFSAFSELSPSTRANLDRLPAWIGDADRFGGGVGDLRILELPGVEEESCRDWHGWTLGPAFRRVLELTAVQAASRPPDRRLPEPGAGTLTLGRLFWNALIRGGVQAGVYVIDSLCRPGGKPKYTMRKWMA
jgi:biotin carboxylase